MDVKQAGTVYMLKEVQHNRINLSFLNVAVGLPQIGNPHRFWIRVFATFCNLIKGLKPLRYCMGISSPRGEAQG